MAPVESAGLLERAGELDVIQTALGRAVGGAGSVVLIEGEAGVGKSALLIVGRALASGAGMTVLGARANALEVDLPFGLARKLLAPRLDGSPAAARLLGGTGALAAPLFAGRGSDADVAGSLEGCCAIVETLALAGRDGAAAPVVLVADDLQWADAVSLRFLIHLAGRIDDLPVVILAARRSGEPVAGAALLDALGADPAAVLVRPAPLSVVAVGRLVRAALGETADERLCAACARVTGGNPFYVAELLRELGRAGLDLPSADAVAEAIPASVTRSVTFRLARLTPEAAALAFASAVAGDGASLSLSARLAGLDEARAVEAADALVAAAILSPGEPLCFAHPLVAAAVYGDSGPFALARAHRRVAELLVADDAAPERVAAHLLLVPAQGDQAAVGVLAKAASLVRVRGEPQVAARMLERALAEGPPPAIRADLLVELAGADVLSGSAAAVARLEEALGLIEDPHQRARVLRAHAAVLHHAGDLAGAAAACERGAAGLGADDPLREQLLAGFVGAAMLYPPLLERARTILDSLLDDARQGRLPGAPALCAQVAIRAASIEEPDELVATLAEAAFAADPLVDEDSQGASLGFAAQALIWVDALDAARRAADAAAEAARARGALMPLAIARINQATVAYHQGRLDDAVAAADLALEVNRHGWTDSTGAIPVLALAHLERGDTDAARAAIVLGEEASAARPEHAMLLESRARLVLADGDARRALADARAAGDLVEVAYQASTARLFRWRQIGALAALRAGKPEEAETLAARALADARAMATPRQLGETLMVAGIVAGGNDGIAYLAEAVAVLERSPSRLERARALVELRSALRRGGSRSEAHEPLARALELAVGFGAAPMAERAHRELGLAGVRPRRAALHGPAALTAGERAVADLAARGLTNPQIAERLYIARKTVESHLAATYRKLGIASRRDLGDHLGAAPDAAIRPAPGPGGRGPPRSKWDRRG